MSVKLKMVTTFGQIKEQINVVVVMHNVNLVLISIPSAHNAKIIYMFWPVGNVFQKQTVKLKLIRISLRLLIK